MVIPMKMMFALALALTVTHALAQSSGLRRHDVRPSAEQMAAHEAMAKQIQSYSQDGGTAPAWAKAILEKKK